MNLAVVVENDVRRQERHHRRNDEPIKSPLGNNDDFERETRSQDHTRSKGHHDFHQNHNIHERPFSECIDDLDEEFPLAGVGVGHHPRKGRHGQLDVGPADAGDGNENCERIGFCVPEFSDGGDDADVQDLIDFLNLPVLHQDRVGRHAASDVGVQEQDKGAKQEKENSPANDPRKGVLVFQVRNVTLGGSFILGRRDLFVSFG
mmetsp:Transcript_22697/g.53614  ORF Transcript_22697/g.53614 Transcript_22697/m.53614 type:complete len:204 (-) Transcript_22697:241-852(-)